MTENELSAALELGMQLGSHQPSQELAAPRTEIGG